MSPKIAAQPIAQPKTLTTRLEKSDDERLEKVLLEARLRGVVPTSYSKSDFIREAVMRELARLESKVIAQR